MVGNKRQRTAALIATKANQARADRFALTILPTIKEIIATAITLGATAKELNARGIKAQRGGKWSAGQVRHVLLRDLPKDGGKEPGE